MEGCIGSHPSINSILFQFPPARQGRSYTGAVAVGAHVSKSQPPTENKSYIMYIARVLILCIPTKACLCIIFKKKL